MPHPNPNNSASSMENPSPLKATENNFFEAGSPYLNHPLLTPERSAEEIEFVLSETGLSPGDRVLDIGCGFGRHSIELARRKYAVVGIDPSTAMIQAARTRARNISPAPKFLCVRGEDYKAREPFHAAICLFTTLGQMQNGEDNRALLQCAYDALHPDGHFVVEIPQRSWVMSHFKAEERFGDATVYTHIHRYFDKQKSCMQEIFRVRDVTQERVYTLTYRLFDLMELVDMLKAVGFVISASYSGYSKKPVDADSPTLLVFAQNS